jgi:hypothetical protein
MRIREDGGELASAETNYVYDIHPTARGEDKTKAVILAKFMKSRMNSVGAIKLMTKSIVLPRAAPAPGKER